MIMRFETGQAARAAAVAPTALVRAGDRTGPFDRHRGAAVLRGEVRAGE